MKIPKSVAKGMKIVGLVGALGGSGCSIYSAYQFSQLGNEFPYERLAEIDGLQEEMERESIDCIIEAEGEALSDECVLLGSEYPALTQEVEQIKGSEEYQALEVERGLHSNLYPVELSLFLFSGLLFYLPGMWIHAKRELEEKIEEDLKVLKKIEKWKE